MNGEVKFSVSGNEYSIKCGKFSVISAIEKVAQKGLVEFILELDSAKFSVTQLAQIIHAILLSEGHTVDYDLVGEEVAGDLKGNIEKLSYIMLPLMKAPKKAKGSSSGKK